MLRKKHLLQNNASGKRKGEALENPKSKVTVQYIQEQQLLQKTPNNNHQHIMHDVTANVQDDLEIENVEYLEDNGNVEEYIEDPSEKYELDIFYPNAIHCLLDLYKKKYDTLKLHEEDKVSQIWRDIAKDMQESFFEFNERQIQHKYALLREQYFNVQTKDDIENFDYFQQLHDIYNDVAKENVVRGLKSFQVKRKFYKDEILLHYDINEDHLHDFKSEEIAHKEDEFIDIVEKELQAMEDGTHIEDGNKETCTKSVETSKEKHTELKENSVSNKDQNIDNIIEPELNRDAKLTHSEKESHDECPPKKQKTLNDYIGANELITDSKKFSLYDYNKQQEIRHREKMSLLERSLQIQEHALEQQHQLLQELIKRLPS